MYNITHLIRYRQRPGANQSIFHQLPYDADAPDRNKMKERRRQVNEGFLREVLGGTMGF